jgi:hypothetical protein
MSQLENIASTVAVDSGKVLTYLGLNPSDPKSQAAVSVAQRYDLDPVLKHVIVIPKGGVYITRDGLLHIAHRSGQLDGIVVEQEPTLSEDGREWVCRVSVYRKDMGHPFTFPGRYPVGGGNRDYPQEMALKAAEAHALRRAFDVTGLPALDEQRPVVQPVKATGIGAVLETGQTVDRVDAEIVDALDADLDPEPLLLATSSKLAKAMYAGINGLGITDADRLPFIVSVIGREIGSTKEMTEAEARKVLAEIDAINTVEQAMEADQ